MALKPPSPIQLTYFVGNANGRGLVRIEIDGRCENAGFHICSASRGRTSWIATLVDRWNQHESLVEALKDARAELDVSTLETDEDSTQRAALMEAIKKIDAVLEKAGVLT